MREVKKRKCKRKVKEKSEASFFKRVGEADLRT